jgi:hypothetical protein
MRPLGFSHSKPLQLCHWSSIKKNHIAFKQGRQGHGMTGSMLIVCYHREDVAAFCAASSKCKKIYEQHLLEAVCGLECGLRLDCVHSHEHEMLRVLQVCGMWCRIIQERSKFLQTFLRRLLKAASSRTVLVNLYHNIRPSNSEDRVPLSEASVHRRISLF